ncbi:MAG: DUF3791 domain-containing protein [Bacteroidales bacterium]|jgi:hypothetical protein|nr:DUF3791 domain-containing protein [Bacteroidales bacterium]
MYKTENIDKVEKFAIFAIEEYRAKKGLSGKDAFNLFEESGLFDYIIEFYDVLHSYGSEFLENDFDEYLRCRNFSK